MTAFGKAHSIASFDDRAGRVKGAAIVCGAVRFGTGRQQGEPSIALQVGTEVIALTPNEARRLVNRLEDAIRRTEERRKTG